MVKTAAGNLEKGTGQVQKETANLEKGTETVKKEADS